MVLFNNSNIYKLLPQITTNYHFVDKIASILVKIA